MLALPHIDEDTHARTRVRGSNLSLEAASGSSWSSTWRTPSGSTCTYGETAPVGPIVTNLRLPGQYDERLLGPLGLQGPYYNWNRWYLPSLGRYLEPDPIKLAGGALQIRVGNKVLYNTAQMVAVTTLPWYSYAHENPLRYTDPTGAVPIPVPIPYDTKCEVPCLKVKDLVAPECTLDFFVGMHGAVHGLFYCFCAGTCHNCGKAEVWAGISPPEPT